MWCCNPFVTPCWILIAASISDPMHHCLFYNWKKGVIRLISERGQLQTNISQRLIIGLLFITSDWNSFEYNNWSISIYWWMDKILYDFQDSAVWESMLHKVRGNQVLSGSWLESKWDGFVCNFLESDNDFFNHSCEIEAWNMSTLAIQKVYHSCKPFTWWYEEANK